MRYLLENLMQFKIKFYVELLYILRPFIYFSLIYFFGKKSFIPLLINMAIESFILKFSERKDEKFMQQKIYFYEYKYRFSRLTIYLLREPIFSYVTKPFLEKFLKTLRLPDKFVNFFLNVLDYFTKFYYIL